MAEDKNSQIASKVVDARTAYRDGDFQSFAESVDEITDAAHMDPQTEKRTARIIPRLFSFWKRKNT